MPENQSNQKCEVFISYSHDSPAHERSVLALANQLVEGGLDVTLDQFVDNGTPEAGWPLWMESVRISWNRRSVSGGKIRVR